MKRGCHFHINPAFSIGLVLVCVGVLVRHVPELNGAIKIAANFLSGAGAGLVLIGFLYGAPRTRPLFARFRTLKLRLLGRAE